MDTEHCGADNSPLSPSLSPLRLFTPRSPAPSERLRLRAPRHEPRIQRDIGDQGRAINITNADGFGHGRGQPFNNSISLDYGLGSDSKFQPKPKAELDLEK